MSGVTGYIPGEWEKFLVKGEILKFMANEKEIAEQQRLKEQRRIREEQERLRKAASPSKDLIAKAKQFGIELTHYDPSG